MSRRAVDQTRKRFTTTASALYGMHEDLPDALGTLGTGVGSYHAEIDQGLTPFTASWQAVFDLCEREAETISANVNQLWIDLGRLDGGS